MAPPPVFLHVLKIKVVAGTLERALAVGDSFGAGWFNCKIRTELRGLDFGGWAGRLKEMRLGRLSLMVAVVAALAAYAIDCSGMSGSDAAMQCCETMPCASQGAGHSQDCCKSMPSAQAPFMRAQRAPELSPSLMLVGISPGVIGVEALDLGRLAVASGEHGPPLFEPQSPTPLRI